MPIIRWCLPARCSTSPTQPRGPWEDPSQSHFHVPQILQKRKQQGDKQRTNKTNKVNLSGILSHGIIHLPTDWGDTDVLELKYIIYVSQHHINRDLKRFCFYARFMDTSVKSKEMSNESLVVLGSRDKQWSVMDKVTVRSLQKGLVSFDLMENFDRFVPPRFLLLQ